MQMLRRLSVLRLRLRSIVARRRVEDDLRDELEDHLLRRERELTDAGMSREVARATARRAFGGLEQRKEECRDARRVGWIEDPARDVRYAFAYAAQQPGIRHGRDGLAGHRHRRQHGALWPLRCAGSPQAFDSAVESYVFEEDSVSWKANTATLAEPDERTLLLLLASAVFQVRFADHWPMAAGDV